MRQIISAVLACLLALPAMGQTLFAPSGTLGSSTIANVGIGTSNPSSWLQKENHALKQQLHVLKTTGR
ncbi:hypothetical protein [Compostibacter hankyongensis]|uniref:hypothetical protein n=1 Tax=Compostibacter hankyongensis TaxID=1007089 RepID=UPI0031EE8B3A